MSLFEVFDDVPDDDLGARYAERVMAPRTLTESDQDMIRALLTPRIYPCQRCSQNVSIHATSDPGRPTVAICDGCGFPPTRCTCERIPYHAGA